MILQRFLYPIYLQNNVDQNLSSYAKREIFFGWRLSDNLKFQATFPRLSDCISIDIFKNTPIYVIENQKIS